jgi:hypothetical protein
MIFSIGTSFGNQNFLGITRTSHTFLGMISIFLILALIGVYGFINEWKNVTRNQK